MFMLPPVLTKISIAALLSLAATSPLAAAEPVRPMPAVQQGCTSQAPVVLLKLYGLKDRSGRLKIEFYPANETDFLKDDTELRKAGKLFVRTETAVPQQGPVSLCVAAPPARRFAVLVIHQRSGGAKFSISKDGIGVPGNDRLGRKRPTAAQATVDAENRVTTVTARMQYMRGLSGFGPLAD
jgi:uncharacterized protein (DUF2141 family)